jgi:Tfp pilus assembly protein PilX
MTDQGTGSRMFKTVSDERGIAFMTVMILTLMTGVLGVAALTMTGLENSMAGASPVWVLQCASSTWD